MDFVDGMDDMDAMNEFALTLPIQSIFHSGEIEKR